MCMAFIHGKNGVETIFLQTIQRITKKLQVTLNETYNFRVAALK